MHLGQKHNLGVQPDSPTDSSTHFQLASSYYRSKESHSKEGMENVTSSNARKTNPTGVPNRQVVTLDRGGGTTATVQIQGCVVSSWRVNYVEQLFTPVTADYSRYSRFKGGITLSFPYDPPCEITEVYELTRLYQWTVFLEPKVTERGDVTATILMKDDLWTKSAWDASFLLFYKITLRERSLICDLRVVNPSPSHPIEFKIHLQMNFQVKTVEEWNLKGLQGEVYCDKLVHSIPHLNPLKVDVNDELTYGKTMYRIYQPRSDDSCLYYQQKVDECEVRRTGVAPYRPAVKISRKNFPDITVRYPWCIPEKNTDGIKAKHFIADAHRDAVCVGNGHISKMKKLQPGEMYRAYTKILILPDGQTISRMAQLQEPDLLRRPAQNFEGFDLQDVWDYPDPDSSPISYNTVPNSGTLGFGWWSLR